MSRSIWATALAVSAVAVALFTAALLPGVALAAPGHNAPSSTHHPLLGPGSGFQSPSGAVRSLQTKLTARGFSPGPVDGRFGPLTGAAVKRFQRADGLAVDGIVGPRTRRGLAAGGLLPGAGSIRPANAVRSLQRRLQRSGFSPGQADGRYGPRTIAAVKRFQHARHLAASGIASAATLRALTNHTRRPTQHPAAKPKPKAEHHPAPATPRPAPTHTNPAPAPVRPVVDQPSGFPWTILVVLGGLAIVALAMFAVATRRPKRQLPEPQTVAPPADQPTIPAARSVSRDPTSSAAQIAALEAAVAMPSAGTPANAGNNRTVDTPAPLAVDKPQPSAERLERVKALQRQLTWLGFDPGLVDGHYGPHTTDAVRRFQQVRGLPADGIAHPATLAALQAGTPDRPFSGRAQRVQQLQRELATQGFDPGPDDGRYGPHTTEAVKRFQRAHSLPDDGVADHTTLQALHGQKPTPPQPTPQPFTQREQRVKELQHQLAALDLEPGLTDGRYGPKPPTPSAASNAPTTSPSTASRTRPRSTRSKPAPTAAHSSPAPNESNNYSANYTTSASNPGSSTDTTDP